MVRNFREAGNRHNQSISNSCILAWCSRLINLRASCSANQRTQVWGYSEEIRSGKCGQGWQQSIHSRRKTCMATSPSSAFLDGASFLTDRTCIQSDQAWSCCSAECLPFSPGGAAARWAESLREENDANVQIVDAAISHLRLDKWRNREQTPVFLLPRVFRNLQV